MSKIIIYCGEDIVSSRKAFLDQIQSLRDKDFEVIRLHGKEITEESMELAFSPTSLFDQKKCLAVEGLLSIPKSKEKDKIINNLARLLDCQIIVWEGKGFNRTEQAKYSKFFFKNFKLPSSVFTFLDNLAPGKPKENISVFHQTISEVDPAFVFLMLVRQFRLLILASENELSGMPSWQSDKLLRQAKFFAKDELLKIYKKFLEVDFMQKTSQIPVNLVYELDLLITEI